jgi:hypothetical protein
MFFRAVIRYRKFDIYRIVLKFEIENSIYIVSYRVLKWAISMYLLSSDNCYRKKIHFFFSLYVTKKRDILVFVDQLQFEQLTPTLLNKL